MIEQYVYGQVIIEMERTIVEVFYFFNIKSQLCKNFFDYLMVFL